MNFKKATFKIILFSIAFLAFLGFAGLLLQHYLNDRIKDLFIQELNKQLTTEVQVDQVRLSLFKDFPYASVRFSGVKLKEAVKRQDKGTLLKADVISLRFGLLDLLRNRFTVTHVVFSGAFLNMRIFGDGTDNYHFWKSSSGKKEKEFSIDIQQISIINSRFSYKDEASGYTGLFVVSDINLKGKFAEATYSLRAKGNLLIELFAAAGTKYVDHRQADIDVLLDVNSKSEVYTFKKSEISLNDLHCYVSGWVIDRYDRKDMDLKISTSKATLKELVSTLPEKYSKILGEYRYKGNSTIAIHLKGFFGNNRTPAVSAELTLEKGEIGRQHTNVSLENVDLVAVYSCDRDFQNERLNITGLHSKIKNGGISGSLLMKGLRSPQIIAALKADVDLDDIKQLLDIDTIQSMKGRLIFDGHFEGQLEDIHHPTVEDLQKSRLSGKAEIRKGELSLKGYSLPLEEMDGEMAFNTNELKLSIFSFRYGRSAFIAKGNVQNLMAWLFVKNQKLSIQGNVSSERTDWDEISESSSGNGQYNFQLPDDINIEKLQVNVNNFTFRKFSATGISANLELKNHILIATKILMQSMHGVVNGQGSINASSSKYSLIQCKATFNKVNLKSLFAEFGNFGSTDLTSDNLDGVITADVIFAATMYPNLEIDMQSVKTHADIRVENGRLVNYAPMQGLSKFLRVEDLSDIKFATLQNQVDIANRIIYIPNMQIKSSALDLNLMGTHTFDNELEYHFSIALADLLASKFHKRNPTFNKQSEFGPIEDDGRGRTMVFVSMTGTVDNPQFGYDKKAVREKISTELKNQKTELKEALRKEFSRMQTDTIRKSQNLKQKAIQKKQEDGKFVIEWDDDKKIE
jgi:hypothetical protein